MKSGDMTKGSIWGQILFFSAPLLLGNVLQQAYNAFDAIVVGNFVSNEALAAVGASAPLINIIVSFFIGLSSGASVLISQHFGAKDGKKLQDTVHTALLLSVILGIALAAVGFVSARWILSVLRTPVENGVLDSAVDYLRIFSAGMPALTVYNMGASVLMATGDSKRPLLFLLLTSILNIALNLLFVLCFHMGVAGVAYATILSELVCAALVVVLFARAKSDLRLRFRRLKLHGAILRGIVAIGLPGGIQGVIVSGSNAIVQSYINLLGNTAMAGYIAASRIDAFISMPMQSVAVAASTFVGQNLGAGQIRRARDGVRVSSLMSLISTVPVSVAVFLFGPVFLRAFTPDAEIIACGMEFMRVFAPAYVLFIPTCILSGALRGAGDVKLVTLASVGSFVVIRQIYLFAATRLSHSIFTVALGYPITWLIASAVILFHYRRSDWRLFERAGTETNA